jgi:O-antigen/teichoic acid export membrane protein
MREQGLSARVLKGFAYLGSQAVVAKLSGVVLQFVLSWLLRPEDFGAIGLTYTVGAFATLLRQFGIREFLVRRKRADLWLEQILWFSLSLGTLGGLLLAAAAPIASALYREPRIVGLLLTVAAVQPISALNTVLTADVQRRMEFRTLAGLGMFSSLAGALLAIGFAVAGFEAYSFVLPGLVTETAALLFLLGRVRPGLRRGPDYRKWRYFARASLTVVATSLCFTLVSQGDYMLLGYFHSTATVGVYFFAFGLSTQTSKLLWGAVANILFPAFSTMRRDRERLGAAFRRTLAAVSMIAVPLGMVQIVLAEPLVRLFFAEKWRAAVPLIQVLSFAMAWHAVAEPAVPLLQSLGRFDKLLRNAVVWTVTFLAAVGLAARYGDALAVATAVAGFYLFASPLYLWSAGKDIGLRKKEIAGFYVPSAFCSGVAVLAADLAGAAADLPEWAEIFLVGGTFAAVYLISIKLCVPGFFRETTGSLAGRLGVAFRSFSS